jgi:hypothetical protein
VADFPDSHNDLLGGQVATLATIGQDGIPQLTEVWFLHEDGEVKISLNRSRLKTRLEVRRSTLAPQSVLPATTSTEHCVTPSPTSARSSSAPRHVRC